MIVSWKILDSNKQLESLKEESFKKPVVIFKHSTRCGISLHAMQRLEENWDFDSDTLHFYYLDLLQNRSISNWIASTFEVIHQSPQIIILKDGKSIYDISHQAISVKAIKNAI